MASLEAGRPHTANLSAPTAELNAQVAGITKELSIDLIKSMGLPVSQASGPAKVTYVKNVPYAGSRREPSGWNIQTTTFTVNPGDTPGELDGGVSMDHSSVLVFVLGGNIRQRFEEFTTIVNMGGETPQVIYGSQSASELSILGDLQQDPGKVTVSFEPFQPDKP